MKHKKEEIDELIREVLTEEEAEFYRELEKEETLFQMVSGLYSGPFKWPIIFSVIINIFFFGVGVYAAFQFFAAEEIKELLKWFGIFIFSALSVVMHKILHWTKISVNTLQRDIKRLELQISVLAKSFNKKG